VSGYVINPEAVGDPDETPRVQLFGYAPCPNGCGGPTDDPYGGPCTGCWGRVLAPGEGDEDGGVSPP
jgi:hypothetical protein